MALQSLDRARAVERPTREAQLQRHPSVHHFWNSNKDLFEAAWVEWEASTGRAGVLDSSLFAPKLRAAVEAAWEDPTTEMDVKDLWTEVFPGVYEAQFFDPAKLAILRDYMSAAEDAKIPVRPPHGIMLNRGGVMLDQRSEGYFAAPSFQEFYSTLMETYMRPISRLLFPDIFGYDTQTFGFSIRWDPKKDVSLRAHTDASSVTLNLNLNLPGEEFSGSGVRFFDPQTRQISELSFEPGTALIHHGSVPHESMPITAGERSNFVLWLYGSHGQVARGGTPSANIAPKDRWTNPNAPSDGFAPF